jgi:CRISPR-associated exonuclease Cas4
MDMNMYSEDELLPLSGIQHFAFCERQWALIHIENQWVENLYTVEGDHLHEKVDDPFFHETRGDIIIERSVPVKSYHLGLYGVCDMVEFHKLDSSFVEGMGVHLPRDDKCLWQLRPIEYKRGRPKKDDRDIVQLCAQAISLEEIYGIKISCGEFYYGQTRHRLKIILDDALKDRVKALADRMHELFKEGYTPPPKDFNRCKMCSLYDICTPELYKKRGSVRSYINKMLSDLNES